CNGWESEGSREHLKDRLLIDDQPYPVCLGATEGEDVARVCRRHAVALELDFASVEIDPNLMLMEDPRMQTVGRVLTGAHAGSRFAQPSPAFRQEREVLEVVGQDDRSVRVFSAGRRDVLAVLL